MQVIWTDQALVDLGEVYNHIAEENSQAASRILTQIKNGANQLADFPEMGPVVQFPQPQIRKLLIQDLPYFLFYTIQGSDIEILRVYHMARRWPERF